MWLKSEKRNEIRNFLYSLHVFDWIFFKTRYITELRRFMPQNWKRILTRDGLGGWGRKFFCFWYPLPLMFYCIFKKEFRKFSLFVLSILAIFLSEKSPTFPKNVWNFSTFFKSKKNCCVWTQISLKSLYRSKFSQIFPQKYKNSQFFRKNLYFFKISGAFGAENVYFWYSKMQ